jgi:hypothetical protein
LIQSTEQSRALLSSTPHIADTSHRGVCLPVGRIETRGFGLGWGPNREERSEREVREEKARGWGGEEMTHLCRGIIIMFLSKSNS